MYLNKSMHILQQYLTITFRSTNKFSILFTANYQPLQKRAIYASVWQTAAN